MTSPKISKYYRQRKYIFSLSICEPMILKI